MSKKILINTSKHKQIIDITDEVENILNDQEKQNGVVNIFVTHTTCAITTAD